ncbi:class I SAM-dependent methyltransferase [Pseudonocardia sp.]|uniref:class I SAM-dependent methyltransferase n=1 Tax=Pseudonocardia sp. TaxID=60912 RepID=UPI002637F696|nr:class I SAM-dependent methyltransferase [Pseudonocardia sp.]
MSVGAVFDASAAGFAVWTPLLWDPVGAATVEVVGPRPGERVLDACCGAGAAALPAARAVGPGGHVDAVDLAGALVDAGRDRAPGVAFHTADVTTWTAPAYDVVTCVFGVFFLPDMDAGTAHLLGLLRPGGRIAVTTWAAGSVEPLVGPFAQAAIAEHAAAGNPPPAPLWQRDAAARVDSADKLSAWLAEVGAGDIAVRTFAHDVAVTPALGWELCVGSGARALIDGLDRAAVARVHERYLTDLAVDTFAIRALIGTGVRCTP